MDAIDKEIQELKARWAREAAEREQRVADSQLASLEKMRDQLRSGEWDYAPQLQMRPMPSRGSNLPARIGLRRRQAGR
jgi:hypothetical protein